MILFKPKTGYSCMIVQTYTKGLNQICLCIKLLSVTVLAFKTFWFPSSDQYILVVIFRNLPLARLVIRRSRIAPSEVFLFFFSHMYLIRALLNSIVISFGVNDNCDNNFFLERVILRGSSYELFCSVTFYLSALTSIVTGGGWKT